jgi:hypothetical protein
VNTNFLSPCDAREPCACGSFHVSSPIIIIIIIIIIFTVCKFDPVLVQAARVDLFLRYQIPTPRKKKKKRAEMGREVAGGIGKRTHCIPLRMMISFREPQDMNCFRQHPR